ncbi:MULTISPECIES: SAM-dependent methyltransferase [Frankia]|uniref:Cyclopropane-fatty-acyl-phospholipid synthase n=1 Tax=Frankia alni (strain DSM 45986 / CECT 9034 / ACN14a) TaxID=326424 RepID=Q0RK64_FRAAA|nr:MULTISPECIES: cyclopropane-fatty-acyl-phospholipid synthase family protein [Frankia]CAJ62095.1 Cyclopropane-fatty-acyl-phospholipid synthase [Frankia alni ACN14a]
MTAPADADRAAGAAAAVRHHYDVGDEFYRLWLDSSLTYSCAMWEPVGGETLDGGGDALAVAQERKLRFHLDAVGADRARAVLDVGCGWGSVLARLAVRHGVPRSVGLTLSERQAAHVRSQALPGVEVRLENWMDYTPQGRFDGIISIGAFEHFATPADPPAEKIRIYREFFTRCHRWLTPDGVLSLQTIAYASMRREQANGFIQREIFPDADLPTLAEITAAAEGIFEVRALHNGRFDYARTCEEWARRLRARRDEAVALVGPDVVARYERYLRLSAVGFRMRRICLLRLVLVPYRGTDVDGPGGPAR